MGQLRLTVGFASKHDKTGTCLYLGKDAERANAIAAMALSSGMASVTEVYRLHGGVRKYGHKEECEPLPEIDIESLSGLVGEVRRLQGKLAEAGAEIETAKADLAAATAESEAVKADLAKINAEIEAAKVRFVEGMSRPPGDTGRPEAPASEAKSESPGKAKAKP